MSDEQRSLIASLRNREVHRVDLRTDGQAGHATVWEGVEREVIGDALSERGERQVFSSETDALAWLEHATPTP